MLSTRTLQFLKDLAGLSHAAYQEGGLLFRYTYAHRQAHVCLKGALRDALHSGDTSRSGITEPEIDELAGFFLSALGDAPRGAITPVARLTAATLLEYLKDDLQHDLIELRVEDGDYAMSATLEMAHIARNDYWRLELFWSVD